VMPPCIILHRTEEHCDQCGRRTWRPHQNGNGTFCSRCCPACAATPFAWSRRRTA
jgi:hypothetical protein